MPDEERCPGCGLFLQRSDGPTHPYLGASAACWALYGDLLALEYAGENGLPRHHRLTVDTYAVQHPGVPGRRQEQSVGLHLCRLALTIERALDLERGQRVALALTERPPAWTWLDPPQPNGTLTVRECLVGSPGDLERRVWAWARNVWSAWSSHHDQVDAWLAEAGLPEG